MFLSHLSLASASTPLSDLFVTDLTTEIKLIVATVYANYTTTIVDDTGIEATDGFTIRPKSGKLMLRFTSV